MRRLLAYGALFGTAILTAGCGGGGGSGAADAADSDPAESAGAASDATGGAATPTAAPRTDAPVSIPDQLDPQVLLDLLPKARDVSPLELGIPTVTGLRTMADAQSDPTGPCGAPLTVPSLDAGAGRLYDTVKGQLIAVAVPSDETIDAFIEANRSDLTAGCPSHTTTAIDGSDVTLSTPEAVDVSATTPNGVAWLSTVEQPAGSGQRTVVLLPGPDVTMLVSMNSIEPIDANYVQQIADVFFAKVASSV